MSLQKETQDKLNLLAVCYEVVGQNEKIRIKIKQKQCFGKKLHVSERKLSYDPAASRKGKGGSPHSFLACHSWPKPGPTAGPKHAMEGFSDRMRRKSNAENPAWGGTRGPVHKPQLSPSLRPRSFLSLNNGTCILIEKQTYPDRHMNPDGKQHISW